MRKLRSNSSSCTRSSRRPMLEGNIVQASLADFESTCYPNPSITTTQGTTTITQGTTRREISIQGTLRHVKKKPEKVRWCGSSHCHQFPNRLVEPVVCSVSVHLRAKSVHLSAKSVHLGAKSYIFSFVLLPESIVKRLLLYM